MPLYTSEQLSEAHLMGMSKIVQLVKKKVSYGLLCEMEAYCEEQDKEFRKTNIDRWKKVMDYNVFWDGGVEF